MKGKRYKKVTETKLSNQSPFSSHHWFSKWILPHFLRSNLLILDLLPGGSQLSHIRTPFSLKVLLRFITNSYSYFSYRFDTVFDILNFGKISKEMYYRFSYSRINTSDRQVWCFSDYRLCIYVKVTPLFLISFWE